MSNRFGVCFFWAIITVLTIGCNDVSDSPDGDTADPLDTNNDTHTDVASSDADTDSQSVDENDTADNGTETDENVAEDTEDPECYSPVQNLGRAYDPDAAGCPCDPGLNEDVCADGVGLICSNFRWQSVEDGPCMALEYECFFPENPYSVQFASEGCECDPEVDEGVCNQYAFVCMDNHWITVFDGPCGME